MEVQARSHRDFAGEQPYIMQLTAELVQSLAGLMF